MPPPFHCSCCTQRSPGPLCDAGRRRDNRAATLPAMPDENAADDAVWVEYLEAQAEFRRYTVEQHRALLRDLWRDTPPERWPASVRRVLEEDEPAF